MRRRAWISLSALLVIPFLIPVTNAGDCSFGSAHAWFQGPDGGWQDATAHPILRPGQVFQIKLTLTLMKNCSVFFLKLHEFGTSVYEVVTGPTRLEELLSQQSRMQTNESYTYTWTLRVRPATTWTQASAPLEVFAQLNTNDSVSCEIDFDVINAYIQRGFPPIPTETQATEQHTSHTPQGPHCLGFSWRAALVLLLLDCLILTLTQYMLKTP